MLYERENIKRVHEENAIIKSLAYDALIEYGINSLPVSIQDCESSEFFIFSWQQYLRTNEKPIYCDITKYDGLIMSLSKKDKKRYVIFYNEKLPLVSKQWIVARLLYYARCDIADNHPGVFFPYDCLPESEEFAYQFMCPDVVLETSGIVSAEDIMRYCQVPFGVALRKARYFKNGHDNFIFPALEKVVQKNFGLFFKNFFAKGEHSIRM